MTDALWHVTGPGLRDGGGSPDTSRRSWRRVLAAAAVTGIAVTAAACGGGSNSASPVRPAGPEKRDLVVAVVPAEANAGLYIAQAKGLFTNVGLRVTIKPVVSAAAVIPAMLHGSVDVDGGGYVSYIGADAAGIAKMRILAAGFALGPHVNEIITAANAPIRTLAGLKGKTIAVNQLGGVGADLVYSALASYGITPAQVHLIPMSFPKMPAELAAGKIAAAYETEPFVTEAVKKYGVQELADMDNGSTQDFPLTGYAALASWVARYPRTAAAFTKAIEQGNAIASTDLAVLQQVLAKDLHLSPSIAGVMATGTFPTSANTVQIQRAADLMLQYGQLKQRFDVSPLVGADVTTTRTGLAADVAAVPGEGASTRGDNGDRQRRIHVALLSTAAGRPIQPAGRPCQSRCRRRQSPCRPRQSPCRPRQPARRRSSQPAGRRAAVLAAARERCRDSEDPR